MTYSVFADHTATIIIVYLAGVVTGAILAYVRRH